MKAILSFSALVIGCAVPATAHAQPGSAHAGQEQHQAEPQDHSRHQAGQAGAGRHGSSAASTAPHQTGMQDCKCCCCEAMRKKMQEHGRGAEAESHQGDR
jgi:hypothetical protein